MSTLWHHNNIRVLIFELRCLIGFLISLTPLACDLMGWRGAGNADGSASIGAYFFFGGLLMNVGAVGEVRYFSVVRGSES